MAEKKQNLVINLDQNSLKELRKILFANGISVCYFFSFITELATMNDERINSILLEAKEKYEMPNRNRIKGTNDSEHLYKLIEDALNNKNE